MKKKEYISPAIQVFEMNTPCILAGSGEETGGGSTGSGITVNGSAFIPCIIQKSSNS